MQSHLTAGGRKRSYWAATGVGLVCFVVVVAAVVAVVPLLLEDPPVIQ